MHGGRGEDGGADTGRPGIDRQSGLAEKLVDETVGLLELPPHGGEQESAVPAALEDETVFVGSQVPEQLGAAWVPERDWGTRAARSRCRPP